jgi:hypothetical protein
MRVVPIQASPKQLSRLRNGHRVRIKQAMEGTGFNLIVDPAKFDSISRSFAKGSAYDVQLSPDELMANKQAAMEGSMEGSGIFAGGRIKMPSTKKIGKTLEKAGKTAVKGVVQAEREVRKNPVSRTLVKELVPLAVEQGVKGLAMYAGADPATSAALGKVGSKATRAGLSEAGYGLYAGGKLKMPKTKKIVKALASAEKAVRKNPVSRTLVKELVPLAAEEGIKALATYAGVDPGTSSALAKVGSKATKSGLSEAGYGLYAGASRGRGMCGGLLGPPSRMPEVSSISVGGTLLGKSSHLPPALQSDAMGANFHMSTQLPVHLQRNRFV